MKLIDLIGLKEECLKKAGVELGRPEERKYVYHLASKGAGSVDLAHPLIQWQKGNFREWQRRVSGKWWECGIVISLIKMFENDRWLFGGVWTASNPVLVTNEKGGCTDTGCPYYVNENGCTDYGFMGNQKKPKAVQKAAAHPLKKPRTCYRYEMKLVEEGFDDILGKAIIKYHNTLRNFHRYPKSYKGDDLEANLIVKEILPEKSSIPAPVMPFVSVTHEQLAIILDQNIESWKNALTSNRGIYVLTDRTNGKVYVGQALDFYSRWELYMTNPTNCGAKQIEKLEREHPGYIRNFQFSILERCGDGTDLWAREEHWKDVLKSREHGYNDN